MRDTKNRQSVITMIALDTMLLDLAAVEVDAAAVQEVMAAEEI